MNEALPLEDESRGKVLLWMAVALLGLLGAAGYFLFARPGSRGARLMRLREYWENPAAHPDWTIEAGRRCSGAPFLLPSGGMIGFLWGDSFRPGHAHQGIDIFGPSGPEGLGETPVVAAYDGYVTRELDWRSALIQRLPRDPLQPDRQIWLYYTHMADPEGNSFIADAFPPGTREAFVAAGTVLGYQGNYSGNPDSPTGMHLHFSIVKDDGRGDYLNELEIENTIDPSPYLGIEVNSERAGDSAPTCPASD